MEKRRSILSVFICVHLWFQFIMLLKITHETHLDYSEPVSEAVMELLRDLHRQGATICMVTHDPRYAEHADRTIHLFDGQVVEESVQAASSSE